MTLFHAFGGLEFHFFASVPVTPETAFNLPKYTLSMAEKLCTIQ